MIKELAVVGIGVLAGDWIFTKFLAARYNDQGQKVGGFIDVQPGFGMDDVIHAGVIAVVIVGSSRLLKKVVPG